MKIIEVTSKKLKKQFIDFPHDLYADDPNYVPEVFIGQKDLMNEAKNPFFKHSKATLFLAKKGEEIVGRIAAIRNNNYNEFIGVGTKGFFGFFDVIEDYEVAKLLLDTVSNWCKKENLNALMGPTNFSTNDTAGLLVEGFDRPPVVSMTYNKLYFKGFLERYGFEKSMDMLAYHVTEEEANMKAVKLASRLEERLAGRGITIRKINMKKFDAEIDKLEKVYIKAWDKNWGFVPPTSEEFQHLGADLKLIADPELVLLAEEDGKTVGFVGAIPDMNMVLKKVKRGRLFPFGIFKILFGKKKITRIRVLLLGVLEEYRGRGIEGILYAKVISNALNKGYTQAEASWVLDNNEMMKRGVEGVNMKPYKRYRIYEKKLA
jgi:GNAT superfamily N-acetyltransferase